MRPGNELHALRYDISACVFHQEMDMVGCHHVVQYGETEPLLCFKDPMQVPALELQSFFLKRLERSVAIERLERLELTAI
jgi:hypothetical protein